MYRQDLHKKCRDAVLNADTRAERCAVTRAENRQELIAYLMPEGIVITLRRNNITNLFFGILGKKPSSRGWYCAYSPTEKIFSTL